MPEKEEHMKGSLKRLILIFPFLGLFFIAPAYSHVLKNFPQKQLLGQTQIGNQTLSKEIKIKAKQNPFKKREEKKPIRKKRAVAVINEVNFHIPVILYITQAAFLPNLERESFKKTNFIYFSNFLKTLFRASISIHAP